MSMTTIDDDKTHHMKVTASGQVSVPAEVRRRWGTTRVKITDEGDRLIVEPEPENPFRDLIGILAGPGPTSDEMKAEERAAEEERERRRYPSMFEGEVGGGREGGDEGAGS